MEKAPGDETTARPSEQTQEMIPAIPCFRSQFPLHDGGGTHRLKHMTDILGEQRQIQVRGNAQQLQFARHRNKRVARSDRKCEQ